MLPQRPHWNKFIPASYFQEISSWLRPHKKFTFFLFFQVESSRHIVAFTDVQVRWRCWFSQSFNSSPLRLAAAFAFVAVPTMNFTSTSRQNIFRTFKWFYSCRYFLPNHFFTSDMAPKGERDLLKAFSGHSMFMDFFNRKKVPLPLPILNPPIQRDRVLIIFFGFFQ